MLVQLVPYGRDHANPPVTRNAPWPDGRARELTTAACYDHPDAALDEAERQVLVDALETMDRRRR